VISEGLHALVACIVRMWHHVQVSVQTSLDCVKAPCQNAFLSASHRTHSAELARLGHHPAAQVWPHKACMALLPEFFGCCITQKMSGIYRWTALELYYATICSLHSCLAQGCHLCVLPSSSSHLSVQGHFQGLPVHLLGLHKNSGPCAGANH
jgi:hypothetical protein